MKKPFLSIVIPLYNKEQTIESTIKSILNQSYENYEIIVVNDGSTDESEKKVKGFSDERIKLITHSNHGISYTRNSGVKEAKGVWLMYLDADDRLLPGGIENLINNIIDNQTIIAGNFLINNGKKTYSYFKNNKCKLYDSSTVYKALVFGKLFLRAGSFIIPVEFAKKHLFDTDLNRYEDMKYLIECFNSLRIKYIPRLIMCYELGFLGASIPNENKWDTDYGFHLQFEKGYFWKNCLLGVVLANAVKSYPNKKYELKKVYGSFFKYHIYAKYIWLFNRINRKLGL